MSVALPLAHDSAALHVAGNAPYVGDISAPQGTLSVAFGLSGIARGRIADMDLDPVSAAPGVVAALTADDLPFANDVSPAAGDEPLLAEGEVFYLGQPVFAAVAETHLAARKAARLGRISYEESPPILTIDDALAADSRFEDGPRTYRKGDVDAALDAAEIAIEGRIEIGGQEHFYLEAHAALALPQEGGEMLVHSSSQHPTEIQIKVAEALGAPMSAVRVEVRRMGGGFGGKESQGAAPAVACAVAARATGRPARMRYDRDDDMTISGKRHDFRIDYRAGFDSDGRLAAVDFVHLVRCGWSQDLSLAVADRAMLHVDNAYHLPAARIVSHRLRTHTQSATAFRGFGGPQGMLGIERVMDHAAHVLGKDPLEVRRLNYYRPAAPGRVEGAAASRCGGDGRGRTVDAEADDARVGVPDGAAECACAGNIASAEGGGAPQTTPYGMTADDFALREMTDRLIETSGYHARRAAIAEWNAAEPVLKKGIALVPVKFGIAFTMTRLNQAGALVHVYQDGSIRMNHGGTEMGQGLFRKVAQVAASRFGVPVDAVGISATDTGKVPNTSATAASSGSDLNGMAVKAACDAIRDRMAAHLAEIHQADAAEVRFEDGRVLVGGASYAFAEAARACWEARVSLSATGFYKTPKIAWDRIAGEGRPFHYFAYGVSVSEAAIDTLTGENRILRTDILHDAGASLNPAIDIGQVEGGFVQGAGWLTMEELVWDGAGRLRTHAPSTYKIPACSDRPAVFEVELWDGENREETICRSKAVGEPPLMHGISAFLALSDAIAACGGDYPALDAPATPERVLSALARMRAA